MQEKDGLWSWRNDKGSFNIVSMTVMEGSGSGKSWGVKMTQNTPGEKETL